MSQVNTARPTRGFQFSLVMLLALTGWAAIVCLALKTPTPVWAAVVFLLTMLATLAGGLGILYRTGRARVFAVGFFAGCLSYASCLFITEKHFGGQVANESEMPTTTFASWLFDRLHPHSASMMGGMMGGGMGGGYGGSGSGGMGGSGMGGGGFFSVVSSLNSDQGAVGVPDAAGGSDAQGVPPPRGSPEGSSAGNELDVGDPSMSGVFAPGTAGPATPATPVFTMYYFKEFVVIVHSALAMLMGLTGGVISQLFYGARRETSADR
jgi:hypothetical protein